MHRRDFLASTAAATAFAVLPRIAAAQGAAAASPADAQLNATFDRIFQENIRTSPEGATYLGLDKGPLAALRSQLGDRSEAEERRQLARTKAAIAQIEAVPQAGLSDRAKLDREVVLYSFNQRLVGPEKLDLPSPGRPYTITQQGGAYFSVPDFLNASHPVNDAADAEAYLSRLDAFATALDQDTEAQRRDAPRGLVAPSFCLDLTLGQMAALRDKPAAQSQLVESLTRRAAAKNLAGQWGPRATEIVERKVYPALDRQVALLRELRAKTNADAGVWKVRNGDAIYAAALANATTTDYTPEQVHQMGLTQVREISAQLDTILKSAGLTQGSVGARLTALNTRADQLYPNTAAGREELLKGLNADAAAMQGKLARVFQSPPNDPLEIRAVPVEIQDGAANGYYRSAPLDKSRPAIYYVNLKDVGDWPKYSLPALTYHEGTPGHHLQISILQNEPTPLLRKTGGFGAYTEGWALYAESVANELDGYDGIERAGFLQSYLFRAARLVVDTGIHAKKWTREQATDYLVQTTGFARPRSQREVERYCVSPGQACSYKLGHNVWVKCRETAQRILGPKFDLKQFHEVLRDGSLPLTILERRVEERARALA